MDITAFDSLMDELAKYLGLSGISKTADNQCLLEIGKISVGFRFLPASGNIMIFSVIGQIPDSGRESFYKMLLEANHALFKTAGATLSVYTPLDMVALQYLCNAQTTDAQRFITIVENFAAAAEYWQERCLQGEISTDQSEKSDDLSEQSFLLSV